ncbi:hypothetical protein R6Q59_021547 [Mikania micrantha]
MDITEVSIIHHVGIVLLMIWLLSAFNSCHPLVYFISLIYLYLVHENFSTRFRRKVRFEERRQANQKRVLSDSESVRWLNHLVENYMAYMYGKYSLTEIPPPSHTLVLGEVQTLDRERSYGSEFVHGKISTNDY